MRRFTALPNNPLPEMSANKYTITYFVAWFVISIILAAITSFVTDVLFWVDTVYRVHFWSIFFSGCCVWFYGVKRVAPWVIAYKKELLDGKAQAAAIERAHKSCGKPLPESWLVWLGESTDIPLG